MNENAIDGENDVTKMAMDMIDLTAMLTGDTLSIERPLIELFHDHASALLLTILMQRQAQCSAFDGYWPMDFTGIMASTGMNPEESALAIKNCRKYMSIKLRGKDREAFANIDVERVRTDVREALIREFKTRKPSTASEEE